MDLEILKQKNPNAAVYIAHWRQRYQRVYDFSKTEDQATFFEGVQEMARYIIEHSDHGVLNVVPNVTNVDHMVVSSG